MSLPRLPARLDGLVRMVPGSGPVADIGAGHGLLAAHLAARGQRVIATEVTAASLTELRGNLARWDLAGAVEVRAGTGLEPLGAGEVGGAVIAGMGARTILTVAEQAGDRGLGWLVLQAMQHQALLDSWIADREWRVVERRPLRQAGREYLGLLVEVAA